MVAKSEEEIMKKWKTQSSNIPLVTISCITYNHEKWIGRALDSFLRQETDFPFEILVHDDASTDGTADIIRLYEKIFPSIIKPIYETVNQYSKHDGSIGRIIIEHIRGVYIAPCEGDDYWCDNCKLQKQADYMKTHSDCSLILHNGYFLEYGTGHMHIINPYKKEGVINAVEIIKEGREMPPTASMFYKKQDIVGWPVFFRDAPVGDRTLRMYLILKGYVYYMSDVMCVYSFGIPGSFAQRTKKNAVYSKEVLDGMLLFFDRYNEYTNNKYKDEIEFAKSREWYSYYMRLGKRIKAFKTKYFKKQFTLREKTKIYFLCIIPVSVKKNVKKFVYKQKNKIK